MLSISSAIYVHSVYIYMYVFVSIADMAASLRSPFLGPYVLYEVQHMGSNTHVTKYGQKPSAA